MGSLVKDKEHMFMYRGYGIVIKHCNYENAFTMQVENL